MVKYYKENKVPKLTIPKFNIMFKSNNKKFLWKNASQIIALLIMALQIVCVELSVTDDIEESNNTEILLKTRIDLCAAQMSLGNFEKASEVLSLFNYHDNMLARVIKRAYNNNLENLDTILQFLFENFKCNEKTYTTLFENMKENNHLYEPIVLRFYLEIDKCQLENLKIKVLPYCDWVVKSWGPKIHRGDDKKIHDFVSKWPRNSDSITDHISNIVVKVYNDDIHNYKNTIKFLNKLSSISIKINGYLALLNQMTINNHLHNEEIFEFAFLIKKMEESNQLLDYDSIRLRFPIMIQKIVWKEICTIKNIGKNEYLYAAHPYYFLHGNRRIFTWIAGDAQYDAEWIFEPASGCSTCFFIKNTYWEDRNYLTINDDLIVVAKPLPSAKWQKKFTWKLEPRTISDQNVFFFTNMGFDSGIMRLRASEEYDSERRTTFLAQYDSNSDFHWEIQ